VLTCTCPDFFADRSARLRRLSARVDTLNRHVHRRQQDAPSQLLVVDAHKILSDPSLWADDGIHANPQGHARLAEAATTTVLEAERQLNGGTGLA
jgi:hypothetical protein